MDFQQKSAKFISDFIRIDYVPWDVFIIFLINQEFLTKTFPMQCFQTLNDIVIFSHHNSSCFPLNY